MESDRIKDLMEEIDRLTKELEISELKRKRLRSEILKHNKNNVFVAYQYMDAVENGVEF